MGREQRAYQTKARSMNFDESLIEEIEDEPSTRNSQLLDQILLSKDDSNSFESMPLNSEILTHLEL